MYGQSSEHSTKPLNTGKKVANYLVFNLVFLKAQL